jgi:predicted protein tyrosine phosphatase
MSEISPDSPYKITICGIDELPDHQGAEVTHVLSIIDPEMPTPDAFLSYPEHSRLELRFHDVIEEHVAGYDSPQPHHIHALLDFGRTLMAVPRAGAHLLIHCHMGISRSTAAAVILLAESRPDWPARAVVGEIARIRSKAWPNLRMIEMGDDMLGQKGSLIEAVRSRYRQMAQALPQVAEFMRGAGRNRELE